MQAKWVERLSSRSTNAVLIPSSKPTSLFRTQYTRFPSGNLVRDSWTSFDLRYQAGRHSGWLYARHPMLQDTLQAPYPSVPPHLPRLHLQLWKSRFSERDTNHPGRSGEGGASHQVQLPSHLGVKAGRYVLLRQSREAEEGSRDHPSIGAALR